MKNIWVILNESKDEVIHLFETEGADSKPHWPEFFKHRAGCVFCGRPSMFKGEISWYYNYFYWEDQARWGYSDPDGIGWAAAMALPDPIKMLAMLQEA